jgi:hypothetical protein
MELCIEYLNKVNNKPLQLATDSLKVLKPIDKEELREYLNSRLSELGLDILDNETFPEILKTEGENLDMVIVRNKMAIEMKEGVVIHKAHHGVRVPEHFKKDNYAGLKEFLLEVVKSEKEGRKVVYLLPSFQKMGKKEVIRLAKKNPDILNYYCQEFLTVNTFIPTPSGYVNPATNNNWQTEQEVLEYLNIKERMADKFKRKYLEDKIEQIKLNYINKAHKKIWNEILIKDNLQPLYSKGTKVYLKIAKAYEGRPIAEPSKIKPLDFKYVNLNGQK